MGQRHGQLLYESRPHSESANSLGWSPGGERLAVTSIEGRLQVWEAGSGEETTWTFLDAVGTDVAWSPDGTTLAASTTGGSAVLLDGIDAQVLDELRSGEEFAYAVAWSPDGSMIAVGTLDGRVVVWPVGAAEPSRDLSVGEMVSLVAWSPNGEIVAAATESGALLLYRAATGEPLFQGKAHNGPVGGVAFSPDGSQLATAGFDGAVKLWGIP